MSHWSMNPRRFPLWLLIWGLLALVQLSFAQSIRYSVAVLDFEVTDLTGGQIPQNLGRAMSNAFGTPLFESRRFVVLDRAGLEKILDELALGDTGILNPDEAKKFGEIGGVDIIITGDITVYAQDSYSITAKFTNVSTSEIAEQATLSAKGPQEFLDVAGQFVDRALIRFPLQGQIVAVEADGIYINIGISSGLTEQDKTGIILRPREVAGKTVSDQIGTFTITQLDQELSRIEPQLEPGFELKVDDVVSIQPLTGTSLETAQATEEARPTTGSLLIQGEPLGAEVFFNSESLGVLDEDGIEGTFPLGEGTVEAKADGYDSQTYPVTITADKPATVTVALLAATGSIMIDSGDVSAKVFLNGEEKGQTPLTLENLVPRTYPLALIASGYQSYEERVTVVAGQVQTVTVTLTPLVPTTTLALQITPENAEVLINGELTTERTLERQAGSYMVEVRAEGYEPKVQSVTLQEGVKTDLAVVLEPAPGRVVLMVSEPTFAVLVNGVSQGQVSELSLAPGTYDVEVRSPGKQPQTFKLEVTAGQTTTQAVTLNAQATPEATQSQSATPTQPSTLVITGEEGADVYINDTYQGSLIGGRLEVAINGSEATLLVRKEGYSDFTQQVTLTGQRQEVAAALTSATQAATSVQPPPTESATAATTPAANAQQAAGTQAVATPKVTQGAGLDLRLGTFNNNGKTETLAVYQVLDPATAPKELVMTGPASWNGGQQITFAVDTAQPFYHAKDVIAEKGSYIIASQDGAFSRTLELSPQPLEVAKNLAGEATASSAFWDVSMKWSGVTGAAGYEVSLEQLRSNRGNKMIKTEYTTRLEKRFTSLSLDRSNQYVMCVEAMNWDASQPMPAENRWQPKVSRICQGVVLSESGGGSSGGSSGDGGSGGCGTQGKPSCPPPPQ